MQRFNPEILFKPVMSLRPLVYGALFSLPFLVLLITLAFAQTPTPTPDGDRLKELLCRMAVGNAQEGLQDHFGLYVELYRLPDGSLKTPASYGLLTGTYYGDRGISHLGQDLDDPRFPRYLKDGTQVHNKDAEYLRSITAEFRQGACEALPDPQS